ncbi:DNA glycosylase AlkZ-like family protein [Streptomyces sp. NPDC001135]
MHAPTAAAVDHSLYHAPDGVPGPERIRCMRRTMFVVPGHLAPVIRSATTADDAHRHRARATAQLREGLGWEEHRCAAVEQAVLEALAVRGGATAVELALDTADLREQFVVFPGKAYESRQRASTPVPGLLAAEGHIRRTRPAGSWTSAQFRRVGARPLPRVPAPEAKGTLARHCIAAFGPVTVEDLKWWTGWTVTGTRKALAATGAQAAERDEGTGYLLPEHLEELQELEAVKATEGPDPAAALLPGLDPTPMGWRHRHWYLDPDHTKALFDRNGNIGPTIWWNGRIVGSRAQHADGHINHHLLTDPGSEARTAVEAEIHRTLAFPRRHPRHPLLPDPSRTPPRLRRTVGPRGRRSSKKPAGASFTWPLTATRGCRPGR